MPRVLLIDNNQGHAEHVSERLRSHALEVEVCRETQQAITRLRQASAEYEVIILNVSDAATDWFKTLAKLKDACSETGYYPSPLFLCTSSTKRLPEFELRIERVGARYVYEG